MASTHPLEITIAVHDPLWETEVTGLMPFVRRVSQYCLEQRGADIDAICPNKGSRPVGVAIVLTNNEEIQDLNRRFRGKDAPTNVLSFQADNEAPQPMEQEFVLGDIILAYGVIWQEAREQDKSIRNHLAHMIVHGLLHLLGYDHMVEEEAETMEALERKILSGLGIPDPYQWQDNLPREPLPSGDGSPES